MKTTSQFVRHLGVLLGATTLVFSAWAQNQASLTAIGKWPEYPLVRGPVAVRVTGSYAYLAGQAYPMSPEQDLRLVALDIGAPSAPRFGGHIDTPTYSTDRLWWFNTSMEISGNFAYVALGDFGGTGPGMLAVYSLSQPAAPQLVGTCLLNGWASDMAVAGSHVFVPVTTPSALKVIDVSDSVHPLVQATAYSEGYSICVSVAGHYAFTGGAVNRSGQWVAHLNVIDVSTPNAPVVVGGLDLPSGGEVLAIAAEASLLHLAYRRGEASYEVHDLADPRNPAFLARYQLFPGEEPNLIRVAGNLVYLATSRGLRILDLSDPSNPQAKAFIPLDGPSLGSWDTVEIAGQSVYWSDGYEIRALDVQDPAAPVQVGQIDTGFGEPWISIDGNLAYLLDGQRFRVLNISNPRAPTLVGAKDLNYAGPFKVVGQRGYVAAGTFLQVLDLSNASQPVEAGQIPALSSAVEVVGNRAYVTGGSRFTVIDVANPAAMTELGHLEMTNSLGSPQVVGDYAYCRLDTSDLVIVDIRDPSAMVEIGRYHPTNGVHSFQVVGQYAYVLLWDEKTLHVVDLADPANPKRVGQYLWEGETLWPEELLVQGRCAFVALYGETNRVDILDVGDPTRPVKFGEHYTDHDIADFAMSGNTLYTTSDAGLRVLDFFAPNVSPRLRLNLPVLASGVAVLTWEGGPAITLQKTTDLTNPNWQDVPGTTGQSLAILLQADAAFFRLVQQ